MENGIRCGQILSVIGSIRHLTIECIIVSEENEDGEMDMHIHGTVSDSYGNIYGGYVLEGENPVVVSFSIVIGDIVGVNLMEKKDQESGHLIMHVQQQ